MSDNYLRFYYKYILPKITQINNDQYADINLTSLPSWNSMLGLQFENLVLNNRQLIHQKLNVRPEDIVYANPYFQTGTKRHRGCQIDYLIQTRYKTLFVFEIKFSKNTIGMDVVKSVKEKIANLNILKGYSCVPILIHVNEISEAVEESAYFSECINLCDFLDDLK